MTRHRRQAPTPRDLETADRIHSAAIHLLRRLRLQDAAAGLSAPRLSALSVVAFAGPITPGDLAAAEQVSRPTISRTLAELERDGLITRVEDETDGRVQWIEATARGRRLLEQGRARRVSQLAGDLGKLGRDERAVLAQAAEILERLSLPEEHPRRV